MSPHGPEHVADLRQRVADLLERWDQVPDRASTGRGRSFTPARVKYVGALAAHTFRLGRAAAVMTDAGLTLETAPTVRSLLEHAVTIQWVMAYGDDALWGVVNEEQRQRRNVASTLGTAQATWTNEDAQRLITQVQAELDQDKTPSDATARMFNAMCDGLNIGDDIYLGYRTLSGFAHPTIALAERYIGSHEDLTISMEPKPDSEPTAWLYWTAVGLVWAARAVDMIDGRRPNRGWLRGHARVLDIPVSLELSDAGHKRKQDDEAARRRARQMARRGPRS